MTHVIQYEVPVYRALTGRDHIELLVAFTRPTAVPWDVPLADGYQSTNATTALALLKLLRRTRPAVVVISGYRQPLHLATALFAWLHRIPAVLVSDATRLDSPRVTRPLALRLKRKALQFGLRLFALVIARSQAGVDFHHALGLRARLVPYVVDVDRFAAQAALVDRGEVRERMGFTPGTLVALFVGRLVPQKRVHDLLQAIAQVSGTAALIVGDGPLAADIDDAIADLGLSNRVVRRGFVNQATLPELYVAADVLVLPSDFEAFGVVVIEALACGLPSIVSDACGAAGTVVVDSVNGFVVPTGHIDALADRITRCRSDRPMLNSLAKNARATAESAGPNPAADALTAVADELSRTRPGSRS